MATVTGGTQETVNLSFPIIRKEYNEDGDLVVYGKATDGSLDSDKQIVDPEWSGKALQDWLTTGGNVRVQHSPHLYPAGKGIEVTVGEDGAHWVKSLVVESTAKTLVEKGVLTAYSVGIARPQIVRDMSAPGGKIVGGIIAELSLVDRPANKNCGITLVKSADDGQAEFIGKMWGEVPVTFTPKDMADFIGKRDFSQPEREQAADSGAAMPDGSFPIKTAKDLQNAVHLAGHGKDPEAAKRHIKRRAAKLGLTDQLPDSWKGEGADVTKGEKDCPKCGKEYHSDSKLRSCESCGTKLPVANKSSDDTDEDVNAEQERMDADLEKGDVPPQFLDNQKKPEDDSGQDGEPEPDEDDKPAFLKGALPTDGVEAKDSKPVGRHREPDGGVMEDFEDDAGLQEGDNEPGGQGVPGSDWNSKSDPWYEDMAMKVGPKGYSHGWIKAGAGGQHEHTTGPLPDKLQMGEKHGPGRRFHKESDGQYTERNRSGGRKTGLMGDTKYSEDKVKQISREWHHTSGGTAGHITPIGSKKVKKANKSQDASYAVGRLHDALCAAYHPDEVAGTYPAMKGLIGAIDSAWDDLDKDAKKIVKGMDKVDQAAFEDARYGLFKSFTEMYPNVHVTPGSITAGQFTRPYLSGGHAPLSREASGSAPSPSSAGFGNSTELRSPDQFNRDYLSAGHAKESAGQGNNGNSVPGGEPASARLAAAAKELAANTMTNLHDHLASNHPYLCPMTPGSPDQLGAVSKGQVTELETKIEQLQKQHATEISELRELVEKLGSQPDPSAAPHRGVLTKSASGGAGPADRRSLVDEARTRETRDKQAFFAQLAQNGDAGIREAARQVLRSTTPES